MQTQTQSTISENIQPTNPDIVVSVKGLTKVFKDFWGRPKARAIDNVSFDVYKGEVFGLLGPNGSGKTTTIKILLGLLNPTKGYVQVLGHSPRHVVTKSRIGYLPEESYLYRYLNSSETLDFFGQLFALPKNERLKRIYQLLEMVGLDKVQFRTIGEFSKGMQRRIGLAQALINDPDLVILDEPTSGLDPIGCREMKDLILALAKRGKTVILSSHLLADVEDVCDRVVIYYGGKIQAMGPLKELLANPDVIQITSPRLSKDTLQKIIDILRTEAPENQIKIGTPTQNLESFFLDVVKRAQAAMMETSGATAGHKIADYLAAQGATPSQTEKILERLVQPPKPTKAEPKVEIAPPPPEVLAEKKLEALLKTKATQQTHSPTKQPETPAPTQEPKIDLSMAEQKLSKLLKNNPPDKPSGS